jgi:hypothetical protein
MSGIIHLRSRLGGKSAIVAVDDSLHDAATPMRSDTSKRTAADGVGRVADGGWSHFGWAVDDVRIGWCAWGRARVYGCGV